VGSCVSNKLRSRTSIRRHLELADKQLAELHDELPEGFDVAFAIVHRAGGLALKGHPGDIHFSTAIFVISQPDLTVHESNAEMDAREMSAGAGTSYKID